MKRFTLFVLIIIGTLTSTSVSAKSIHPSDLPTTIQEFVAKHFPNTKISFAKYDREMFSSSYDVILTNGDKLEFTKDGIWEEINCKHNTVPSSILNKTLKHAAETYGKGARVIGIERERKGYKLKFSNGVKITVNFEGQMTDWDD